MGARGGESSKERGEGEVEKREERGRRTKGMEGKKKSSKNLLRELHLEELLRQFYCIIVFLSNSSSRILLPLLLELV